MRTGVKNRNNLSLQIAAFLALAVLFSLWLVTGMLAKYTAQDDAGGSAKVALFNVNADTDASTALSVDASSSETSFDVEMTNYSEVAVQPEIVITFGEAFTEDEQKCFEFSLKDVAASSYAWSDDGKSVTLSGIPIMAAADNGTPSEQTCTVNIEGLNLLYNSTVFESITELNVDSDNDGTMDSCSAEFSFDVDVSFTQVD